MRSLLDEQLLKLEALARTQKESERKSFQQAWVTLVSGLRNEMRSLRARHEHISFEETRIHIDQFNKRYFYGTKPELTSVVSQQELGNVLYNGELRGLSIILYKETNGYYILSNYGGKFKE